MQKNANEIKENPIKEFSIVSNPGTNIFIDKIDNLNQIYNHTDKICFDKDSIYLIPSEE